MLPLLARPQVLKIGPGMKTLHLQDVRQLLSERFRICRIRDENIRFSCHRPKNIIAQSEPLYRLEFEAQPDFFGRGPSFLLNFATHQIGHHCLYLRLR
jgi:hypothetical protein